MLNRTFMKAVLAGAMVVLFGLLAIVGVRYLQRPEAPAPIVDFSRLVSQRAELDAPYVSTEYDIVRAMLDLARTDSNDLVVDLGSGDGRIPILAARDRGARGLGVDLDVARVREAQANARRAGVEGRVAFRQQDLFVTPLGEATVLTLYLLPEINLQLRPRILSQARPGTRVVSNSFDMGDWRPDRRETVLDTNIFLWVVPAQVGGQWRLTGTGGAQGTLALTQRYQALSGTAGVAGASSPIAGARMDGERIAFTADLGEGRRLFEGRVDGDRMAGTGWQAVRTGN